MTDTLPPTPPASSGGASKRSRIDSAERASVRGSNNRAGDRRADDEDDDDEDHDDEDHDDEDDEGV